MYIVYYIYIVSIRDRVFLFFRSRSFFYEDKKYNVNEKFTVNETHYTRSLYRHFRIDING